MLFIGVAVLVVALLGGGIMLAVEHVKHLDQYGDPIGSHDPLTARSTCQNWTSGGPDVIKQYDFYARYVTTDFDFYVVDWTGLTSYCMSHPTTLLTTAMLRTVVLPNGAHLKRSDIHT
jgi:hypothetical protein